MRLRMRLEFPVLTVPTLGTTEFLDKLQEMADSDFGEMVVLSPYADAHIIGNLVHRCRFRDRRLLVVTRYKASLPYQQQMMNEAREDIERISNYTLEDRVTWHINEHLHAKCVICDWQRVLFGSQNLTQYGGLGNAGRGNYELGAFADQMPTDQSDKLKNFVEEIVRSKTATFYPRT